MLTPPCGSRQNITGKYKVTFLPDRKEIEVEEGVTLLEADEETEVYINSLYGGQGLCGERLDKSMLQIYSTY